MVARKLTTKAEKKATRKAYDGYQDGYNDDLYVETLEATEGSSNNICGDAHRCGDWCNCPCKSRANMYAMQSNGSNGLVDNDEQDLADGDGSIKWSFC